MAAEQQDRLLQLFDLFWFKRQILTNPSPSQPNSPNHKPPSFKPTRSFSHQSLSSKALINGGGSPNSVLAASTLLTGEESDESPGKKKKNRSLSELEFEEIKGFTDLGFLFKEESLELVKILPGLQRLKGTKSIDGEDEAQMRPYLSEAWEEMEMNRRRRRRRKEEEDKEALMKMKKEWRLPSVRSEDDMKQHLRIWAQAVASAVK